MPKFVIEREIPGIGQVSPRDMQAIALKSNRVLQSLGSEIQWLHSYVTGDKLYCVYIAPNAEMVYEHAKRGEFPANRVSLLDRMIDPTTAEG
jgi:hypothetical protein